MATQQGPPSRPWFRIATKVRPPPAAATPQPYQAPPPPRPSFIRPAFSQTFRAPPSPPSAPTPPPSNTPLQPSSRPASAVATSPPPAPSRVVSPTIMKGAISSPSKTVKPLEKNSPPSPTNTMKPSPHPPSPLVLPSPQLYPEHEQKTMLVQETKEKTKGLDNCRHMPKPKKPESSKKHLDSEDGGMRIITIAGENKGAVMDLNPFDKKTDNSENKPHSLNIKKENLSDGEKSELKKRNQKSKSAPLMSAVMNCNVQGVNNSLLYNSSTTHHDPGIHLSLSRNPSGGPS